jgi:hypothetical protein
VILSSIVAGKAHRISNYMESSKKIELETKKIDLENKKLKTNKNYRNSCCKQSNNVDTNGVVKIISEFKSARHTRAGRFDPRYGHVPHLYRVIDPWPRVRSTSPMVEQQVVPPSAVGRV